jgi:hypothetical protein
MLATIVRLEDRMSTVGRPESIIVRGIIDGVERRMPVTPAAARALRSSLVMASGRDEQAPELSWIERTMADPDGRVVGMILDGSALADPKAFITIESGNYTRYLDVPIAEALGAAYRHQVPLEVPERFLRDDRAAQLADSHQKSWSYWPIVIALAAIGLAVFLVVLMTKNQIGRSNAVVGFARPVSDAFLFDLGSGDGNAAYKLLTPILQTSTSPNQLRVMGAGGFAKIGSLSEFHVVNWYQPDPDMADQVNLSYVLTGPYGRESCDIGVSKLSIGWKVDSFQFSEGLSQIGD